MHSFLSRLNQLGSYIGFSFGALAIFVALSSMWLNPTSVDGNFTVDSVMLKLGRNYAISSSPIDFAAIKFSLELDLSSSFHWNCKQVFLKMIAFYSTENNVKNEVTVWDKIILRHENHKIKMDNALSNYRIEDDGTGLRNSTVQFILEIERIPNIGFISSIYLEKKPVIKMPAVYSN